MVMYFWNRSAATVEGMGRGSHYEVGPGSDFTIEGLLLKYAFLKAWASQQQSS